MYFQGFFVLYLSMKRIIIFCLLIASYSHGQQTVGVFQFTPEAFPGYTLFAPANVETTYLIDNCGNLQFQWGSNYTTGHSVELLENGTLVRACKFDNNSPITGGGGGGRIEAIRPDQTIAWFFEYSNDTVRLHHDFEPLPNGNFLMIAWELKTQQEAIAAGRDPLLVGGSGLWPDQIIEYNPVTDQIVWEWSSWDHLIQDYDPTKPNFGVVADHPELFDLNFDKGNSAADWQHLNSVAYNADLDQILFGSPAWNEVYIIDHSTTTLEAASHSGGNSGKGGDILYRWGNPEMYGAGDSTDRLLFGQHDPHWIKSSYPHGDKIIIYNNGKDRAPIQYSTVDIIAPVILPNGDYEMNVSNQFLPDAQDYIYTAPNPTDFYSQNISGAEMLPNGNIMICEGASGHFFEIDDSENIVWDYVNPVVTDSILAQEQVVPGTSNLLNRAFRARRLAHDYPGVLALPLTNSGPLERDPYPTNCETQLNIDEVNAEHLLVYPSPSLDVIFVEGVNENESFSIVNALGEVILVGKFNSNSIDIESLEEGIYFLSVESTNSVQKQTVSFLKR